MKFRRFGVECFFRLAFNRRRGVLINKTSFNYMLFFYSNSRNTLSGGLAASGLGFFLNCAKFFFAALLIFCTSQAMAANVYWNVATGNWYYSDYFLTDPVNPNWDTGIQPTISVDDVYIINDGTALMYNRGYMDPIYYYPSVTVGSVNTSTVNISGFTTLKAEHLHLGADQNTTGVINASDAAGLYTYIDGYIGQAAGSTGIVTLHLGATFGAMGNEFNIGYSGSGTMRFTDGSKTTSSSTMNYPFTATVYLARNSGSDGTLDIYDSIFDYGTKTLYAATTASTSATIRVYNTLGYGVGQGLISSYSGTFVGGDMNLATAATTTGVLDINRGMVVLSGALNAGTGNGTPVRTGDLKIDIVNSGSLTMAGNSSIGTGNYVGSVVNIDGGTLNFGTNLALGGGTGSSTLVNIHAATVTGENLYAGGAAAKPDVYVLGSGSTIQLTGTYNAANLLDTHFLLDSTDAGTSAINTSSMATNTINLAGEHVVSAWGMAYQDISHIFTLYSTQRSGSYINDFSLTDAPGMKIVDNGATSGTFKVGFDTDPVTGIDTWDLDSQISFTPGDDTHGWVYIIGQVHFGFTATYDFDGPADRAMVDALIEYLQNGLSGGNTTVYLSKIEGSQVTLELPSELFAAGEYDVLGWGLSHFNAVNGTNITLLDVKHVPEPATWAMLLAGLCGMVWLRRRKP